MIYRIGLLSNEVDDFKMEIEAEATTTFKELNDLIINKLKYSTNEMTSFFSCDDEWKRYQEITLIEMDSSSDVDTYVMENTTLEEFMQDEGDRMLFIFDTLNDRGLYMSLREIKSGTLKKAKCTKLTGRIPKQVKMEDLFTLDNKKGGRSILDDDMYGEDGYNDDELDMEGFSEVDMSEIDI